MFGLLLVIALLAFILISYIFLSRYQRLVNPQQAVLSGSILWGVYLALVTEGLSLLHQLHFGAVVIVWSLPLLGAGWLLARNGSLWRRPNLWVPPWPLGLIAGLVLLLVTVSGGLALFSAPNNWDSMTYHLSRVMHWHQNQTVAHYSTHELRQLYQNPWAEFAILHFQLLAGTDRWANLVQWLAYVGSLVGVSFIAGQFGAQATGRYLTALIAATVPMAVLQAVTTQNDLVLSFWLVCLVSFILLVRQQTHWLPLLGAAGSLGLAVLTKGTAYIFAAPLLLWLGLLLLKRYRWRVWQPLGVVAVVVLLLNSGHYARNLHLFGSPLQPELGQYSYQNEIFSPAAVISNLVRNAALHLNLAVPNLIEPTEQAVDAIHRLLHLDPNDPRTTWPGMKFEIRSNISEDSFGNFLHFSLMVLSLAGLARARVRSNYKLLPGYGGLLCLAFFLFGLYLKWQPWHSRLHLPLFILGAPVVGIMVAELFPRPVVGLLVIVLTTQTGYLMVHNPLHPLWGPRNVFTSPRSDQYFWPNPVLQEPYQAATELIQARGCRQIGLLLPLDFWEYPFWILLNRPGDSPVWIENVQVGNVSQALQSLAFEPCAVVCIRCQEEHRALYTQTFGAPALDLNTSLLFVR
ncbi:MAG TPA: glycosyltransferase family 39 protein [Anaerolineae bacterium]|nr:glycosyltransferase family 39 protein [Anaerolineae bacterium]